MSDAATGSERRFDATVYSPATSGDPSSGDRLQRPPLRAIEPVTEPYQEFVSLQKLGAQKQDSGSRAEAAECLGKALEIGDRMFGPEHPELTILLNDLTRLHLRQGSYAAAEPLLLRLLDLKKSKGEDHPEVATVLASLTSVREGLGLHESAEQLWRHVVDIRDRTLAPNHFATAIALEHLGESCAARGKIRAALAAFERAQLIRERTLGAEHPSVRTSRERIADLQLQSSEDSSYPDDDIGQLSKSPERFRLPSGERTVVPVAQAVVDSQDEKEAAPTERMSVLVMPRPVMVEGKTASPASNGDEGPTSSAEPLQFSTVVAYRDALESVRREIEEPMHVPTLWSRGRDAIGPMVILLRRRQVAGAVAIGAIALVLLGAAAVSRTSLDGDRALNAAVAGGTEAPATTFPVTATRRAIAPANNVASPPALAVPKAATAARAAETHTPSSRKTAEKSSQPNISIPKVSTAIMSRVDSVASKTASAPGGGMESFAVQPLAAPTVNRGSIFSDNQVEAPQHARLIGELPKPDVPYQLANVEGEVRVRFSVDSDGRPVMSTFSVVTSSNPAFTEAVRRTIPPMRFEPARSGGPETRAVTEVVQVGFVFSPRSR
ncbi:MAG: tetratricopeptide repeat protein [Gemmatimonadaceae bacterium]